MNGIPKRTAGILAVVSLLLICTAGCGDKQEAAADQAQTVTAETEATAVRTLTSADEALVTRIAAIAAAIEETPAAAAAILEESGITADQYQAEIFRIASDPALSAAFEKAKNR